MTGHLHGYSCLALVMEGASQPAGALARAAERQPQPQGLSGLPFSRQQLQAGRHEQGLWAEGRGPCFMATNNADAPAGREAGQPPPCTSLKDCPPRDTILAGQHARGSAEAPPRTRPGCSEEDKEGGLEKGRSRCFKSTLLAMCVFTLFHLPSHGQAGVRFLPRF